jgi:hypothetical protein
MVMAKFPSDRTEVSPNPDARSGEPGPSSADPKPVTANVLGHGYSIEQIGPDSPGSVLVGPGFGPGSQCEPKCPRGFMNSCERPGSPGTSLVSTRGKDDSSVLSSLQGQQQPVALNPDNPDTPNRAGAQGVENPRPMAHRVTKKGAVSDPQTGHERLAGDKPKRKANLPALPLSKTQIEQHSPPAGLTPPGEGH